MAQSRIEILIHAKDQASGTIQGVNRQLGALGGTVGTLTKTLSAGLVLAGAVQVGRMAFELGEAGGQTVRLRRSFETLARQAGQSADAMLDAMRQASRGAVSDAALIASANKAMLLGVARTGEQLAQLLEVASVRGRAMGLSTQEAFEDIVTGIGRISPPILDNLGIVTDGQRVFDRYAYSIGKAADQLSDAEEKQALLNAVLEDSADLLAQQRAQGDDLASSFERMDAAISNAKQALRELFAPAVAVVAENIAEAASAATDAIRELNRASQEQQAAIALNVDLAPIQQQIDELEALRIVRDEIAASEDPLDAFLGDWLYQMPDAIRGNKEAMLQWVDAEIAAREGAQKLADAMRRAADGMVATVPTAAEAANEIERIGWVSYDTASGVETLTQKMRRLRGEVAATRALDITKAAQGAIRAVRGEALTLVDVLGPDGALQQFQSWNQEIARTAFQLQASGASADEVEFVLRAMVDDASQFASELTKVETSVGTVDRAFDRLGSKVRSVLSGSLSLDVGVDPADFLPRPDAINEDARRLADVMVRGFESPWASYLQEKFPNLLGGAFEGGDIKTRAAQILRDFQDGLVPQLLDKEAAKERVKRMLLGEANLATMAQEIAAELQTELGGQFSLGEIQSAATVALGSEKAPGIAFGQSVVAGVEEEQPGLQAVNSLVQQIRSNEDVVRAAGENSAQTWGSGFLSVIRDVVPARLIEILVDLTTPGVYEQLLAQGALTGPVD